MGGERVSLELDGALDLGVSWAPLDGMWGDRTLRREAGRVLRATRTPDGPASFELRCEGDRVHVTAHGPGRDWVLERACDLCGLAEGPPELAADAPRELRAMREAALGVRLPRTHRVVESLVLLVLQQLVRGREAARAYRSLVHAIGEPAPGPYELLLPPSVEWLRALRPGALFAHGVRHEQAVTLRELGFAARALEECVALPVEQVQARVTKVRGLGPWSATSLMLRALGAADAVIVGDYHMPSVVAFNLAGERRADDRRMLELLAPYAGMRGWVMRWIGRGGKPVPRRGPRRTMRGLPR